MAYNILVVIYVDLPKRIRKTMLAFLPQKLSLTFRDTIPVRNVLQPSNFPRRLSGFDVLE